MSTTISNNLVVFFMKHRLMGEFTAFRIFSILILLLEIGCKKDVLSWDRIGIPEVAGISLVSNNLYEYSIQAKIVSDGNDKGAKFGFCWSTNNTPTISDSVVIINSSGKGLITFNSPWVTTENKFFRAFAQNELGVFYSDILFVPWLGNGSNIPSVFTIPAADIGFFSATLNAQVANNGGLPIIERGILLSTSSSPTFSNSNVLSAALNNNSIYSLLAENLQQNTSYYYVAFARNIQGIGFGSILSFNTKRFYSVGETGPCGGTIFYSKVDTIGGWNFLEAAPSDNSGIFLWSPANSLTGINSVQIGAGLSNTDALINLFQGSSSPFAAYAAATYANMGCTDWFLPSRDELKKIYDNLYLSGIGGLVTNAFYWSSTEDSYYTQNAWAISMSSGIQGSNITTHPKSSKFRIRTIRRF